MYKYQIEQTSQTFRTVIITGILASTLLPQNWTYDLGSKVLSPFSKSNNFIFLTHGTSPTYEPQTNPLSKSHLSYPVFQDAEFEGFLTDFFVNLSSNQESLGFEFEQVLFEQLWDLYQS